ncbi:sialate:O-sulfotransferase 1-like [Ruditapes philippinarum]|uniref:sialate:O-sulfotransferase 1-like n=1 Tax=Ruditapes philippinarum TaxID=129788 RepID=UPI00295A8B1B|nr:sialate:O-sulfotransferase 1-like [Ruditapes philippinarum]
MNKKTASILLFEFVCILGLYYLFVKKDTLMTFGSCSQAVNVNQYKIVKERDLLKLINVCSKNGVYLNGSKSNYDYLKNSLIKFNCSHSLRFLSAPRSFVALASYPGSGNTWTRQLIETTTGYFTGSVYTDWNFVGSKECPIRGRVFIVKTHETTFSSASHSDCTRLSISKLHFASFICILRNPYNAILAEFNRQNRVRSPKNEPLSPGQWVAPKQMFTTERWSKFVHNGVNEWRRTALYWMGNKSKSKYVLVYERLLENTFLELSRLMVFLNITIQYHSLYCVTSNVTKSFKRTIPQWMTINYVYSTELREIVNKAVQTVKSGIDPILNLNGVLNSYFLPTNHSSN